MTRHILLPVLTLTNSDVLACAEIIDTMNDNIRGDFECATLIPAQ